jgi:hypothetical protein
MTKVFHFDAPRQKYHCDAAIVWGMETRDRMEIRVEIRDKWKFGQVEIRDGNSGRKFGTVHSNTIL